VAVEGLARYPEESAAFDAAFARSRSAVPAVRSRVRWVDAFAVSARLPDNARDAFEDVLREDPDHPQSLYGRAMLCAEQGQSGRADALFDRAIAVKHDFVEARRFRPVLLAHGGNFAKASQNIDWCLAKEPKAGATLYAAACAAALAAEKATDPHAAREVADVAVTLLRHAFCHGYDQGKAGSDPDLSGIRRHAGFQALLAIGGSAEGKN
jgi:hypothetical protein